MHAIITFIYIYLYIYMCVCVLLETYFVLIFNQNWTFTEVKIENILEVSFSPQETFLVILSRYGMKSLFNSQVTELFRDKNNLNKNSNGKNIRLKLDNILTTEESIRQLREAENKKNKKIEDAQRKNEEKDAKKMLG